MTTIAIVGAGPGVGAAVARRFGREGFDVALVSRTQTKLDTLAAALKAEGVNARGFAADVRDREALDRALTEAAETLGPVEVLQYSPLPHREFLRSTPDTTIENLTAAIEFSVYGLFTAANAVLDGMRTLGHGTILLVNGGSAVRPRAAVTGTSVAFAAESAYAQTLHQTLEPSGIHVTQLIVPGGIRDDDPVTNAPAIADHLWTLHRDRGDFRVFHTPMPEL
ncbi:SDR family NAD(P)-dependent oxidoreductase [Actinoplanes sp. TBRC 11911]|uniref:SDR family NAD(P)-dependent oxidoreductase n=1 Tax=Actinoplanes sp. TBRC 11911 TaxID=2729386 RepID=UPI00145F888F|nr:SDR family NAD(P)-dependent oxidoreductase [Actinoplanes sp. TBRC 11911]NMO52280.1 SDR family NAD(P)-dependent oxidoreductase [Actinoplanes sp. TBRC 11911]